MQTTQRVERRRFPYPYRALLAICSDLDETLDDRVYLATIQYLNGRTAGAFGDGLGLEVGNTIFFDMPSGQFSYWNTSEASREVVRALIRSGHIDCLHSFGDDATTRAHAARALDELERHGCRLRVWIDHAVAASNFGGDIMGGSGDVEGAAAYHADLSWAFGIRHVWRGRVTSVTGQEVPRSLRGLIHRQHLAASSRTAAKELVKGVLGRSRRSRYRMHPANRVSERSQLRSGQPVHEFLRADPYWGGISMADTADGIADVLTAEWLEQLTDQEGVCVLYTHLGKARDRASPFSARTRQAFETLASWEAEGRVLVMTTARLLTYLASMQAVQGTICWTNDGWRVEVSCLPDGLTEPDLQGLTIYMPDTSPVRLFVDGQETAAICRHPPDHTGRCSVSIPRQPLTLPW